MIEQFTFTLLLAIILIIVISALPLYFSVKLVGGRTTIFQALLINLFASFVVAFISVVFPFGALLSFIILIWIYHEFFKIKWVKALFVWLCQIIVIFFLSLLFTILGFASVIGYFMIFNI